MAVATGTLDTIVDVRDTAGIEPPAITVIGAVAATRDRIVDFLQNRYDADSTEDDTEASSSEPTDRGGEPS